MKERAERLLTRWLGVSAVAWLRERKRDWDAFSGAVRHRNWQVVRVRRYYRENSLRLHDEGRLVDWPLDERSLVVDVGGFQGDWTWTIARKYNSRALIVEPVPDYCTHIRDRFAALPRVSVFNFGLLDRSGDMAIDVAGLGSSFFTTPQNRQHSSAGVHVPTMDVVEFFDRNQVTAVDLMKLNIEGAEYPVVQRLIDSGRIQSIHRLLIQFHVFYPNARRLRRSLQQQLLRTHECLFDYPFVWECWQRRPVSAAG